MERKRVLAYAGIIILFLILCASCVFIGYTVMGGDTGTGSAKKGGETQMSTVTAGGVTLPDLYKDSMKKNAVQNLDSRVSLAEKLRSNTDSNINSFTVRTNKDGVKKYFLDGKLVRMDIPAGVNELECVRSYYFNNNHLYLADYYANEIHDKMYFVDDVMFRHIAPDGAVSDNDFNNSGNYYMGNFALNEAKDFR